MQKIDSHQHFWKYHPVKDNWITEDMAVLRNDFLPGHVYPLIQQHHISGCLAVQADQAEKESTFLLDLADKNTFIQGVVGWVDLTSGEVESRLQHYKQFIKMKGFRHILQAEPDENFMLSAPFKRGISLLHRYGFTYDLLINPYHLTAALQLVRAFPEQQFVIDHLAKPDIRSGEFAYWRKGIEAIAQHQHVSCKISGLGTEADWNGWQLQNIKPYLDIVFQAFGSNRVMYGSDWPVCNLAGGYDKWMEEIEKYTCSLPVTDQDKFWGGNAAAFYNLNDYL